MGDTLISSKSDASGLPELLIVYVFRELVTELRIRFIAWDNGFSLDLCGSEVSGEEFAEERFFRRSGRREGRDTTIMAVHISAMLHTSEV